MYVCMYVRMYVCIISKLGLYLCGPLRCQESPAFMMSDVMSGVVSEIMSEIMSKLPGCKPFSHKLK